MDVRLSQKPGRVDEGQASVQRTVINGQREGKQHKDCTDKPRHEMVLGALLHQVPDNHGNCAKDLPDHTQHPLG